MLINCIISNTYVLQRKEGNPAEFGCLGLLLHRMNLQEGATKVDTTLDDSEKVI